MSDRINALFRLMNPISNLETEIKQQVDAHGIDAVKAEIQLIFDNHPEWEDDSE